MAKAKTFSDRKFQQPKSDFDMYDSYTIFVQSDQDPDLFNCVAAYSMYKAGSPEAATAHAQHLLAQGQKVVLLRIEPQLPFSKGDVVGSAILAPLTNCAVAL